MIRADHWWSTTEAVGLWWASRRLDSVAPSTTSRAYTTKWARQYLGSLLISTTEQLRISVESNALGGVGREPGSPTSNVFIDPMWFTHQLQHQLLITFYVFSVFSLYLLLLLPSYYRLRAKRCFFFIYLLIGTPIIKWNIWGVYWRKKIQIAWWRRWQHPPKHHEKNFKKIMNRVMIISSCASRLEHNPSLAVRRSHTYQRPLGHQDHQDWQICSF